MHRHSIVRAPRLLRALVGASAALVLAGSSLAAQSVSPPVVVYSQKAVSTFDVSNAGLTPLAVVVEPFSFSVDTLGQVHYAPLDTTKVKLKLSTTSTRLPARATFSVGYEASAVGSGPAWFVITSTFAGARAAGMNVRLQLPHVVYLTQKEALRREDVVVRAFEYDSVAKKVRVKVENTGTRLGRLDRGVVKGAGNTVAEVSAFPLFPHFWRWVEVDWTAAAAPERVELAFPGFTLTADRTTVASARAGTP